MFRNAFGLLLATLMLSIGACSGQLRADILLPAAEHGLHPGTQEAGTALRALLDKARQAGEPCTISLAAGEYHFYAENAEKHELFISNHDQQPFQRVGVPLVKLKKLTLKGEKGCRFIFHGHMLPVLVMDSRNISLQNIDIRYARPFSAEGRIVEMDEESTTLEIHPASTWSIEGGQFVNTGEDWKSKVQAAIAFKPDGRMVPLGRAGDIVWSPQAEQVAPNRVRFRQNTTRLGLSEGDVLVLRSYWRPTPAMLLYRAHGVRLRHVIFRNSMGMALIAQRSSNIDIIGGGCIRSKGRYGTSGADATHFSNCRGHISIKNALYEGMMDDAINVHATCLGITEVISPTEIVARYMHPQAVGFEVAKAGERLQFIHGKTLENNPQLVRVRSARADDARTLRLELESPLPDGIGVGDALENADWHPSVDFCNNTVRHNRARGALFTTPKPVLVEKNKFVWSSGSAILLAGDAQGWYESGRCQNVTIRRNIFDHNLTCLFQFTDAIISICPEVKEPARQEERYHRNILIENNRFLTHRVPLLSAISADGVIFRNNKVVYDDKGPTLFEGVPYRIRHCGDMKLQELK